VSEFGHHLLSKTGSMVSCEKSCLGLFSSSTISSSANILPTNSYTEEIHFSIAHITSKDGTLL